MISHVESFLCPDKQGTLEEGWRIQQLKRCEKNNKDEDNSPKTLTDKNHQALSQKFRRFNKTLEEKTRWEQHKVAACCFE